MNRDKEMDRFVKLFGEQKTTKAGKRQQKIALRKYISKMLRKLDPKTPFRAKDYKDMTYDELMEEAGEMLESIEGNDEFTEEEEEEDDYMEEKKDEGLDYEDPEDFFGISSVISDLKEPEKKNLNDIFNPTEDIDDKNNPNINQVVRRGTRKPRKRDILKYVLGEKGARLAMEKAGVNKQTSLTNENVNNFVRSLNEDTIEMLGLDRDAVKTLKDKLQIRESQSKVEPPLSKLVEKKSGNETKSILDIQKNTFGDNFVREVNGATTGIQVPTLIPVRENLNNDNPSIPRMVMDEDEKKEYPVIGDRGYEEQNAMLEGDENDNFPIAEPIQGVVYDTEYVSSIAIAGNNLRNEQQNAFLMRNRANKVVRGRKIPLDELFGEGEGRRDYGDEKYGGDDEEENNADERGLVVYQEGDEADVGGFDYGELRPIEGGKSMREIIEDEVQKRLLQPKGTWVADRSMTNGFQREAMIHNEINHIKNSQALNYLRQKPIPYRMPSRNYANNQVNLIRNSNRSMILSVNELEP
jgi:hypothetical protein